MLINVVNMGIEMADDSSAKSSCGKRKHVHVALSLESKQAILDLQRGRTTQESLADECGIVCLIVGDINKNEDKIQSFASTMESMAI